VHEGVAAKDERVVVDGCDGCGGCGSDVGEDGFAGCVCADAAEVGVVEGGLGVLVEGGAGSLAGVVKISARWGVLNRVQPCSVDAVEAIYIHTQARPNPSTLNRRLRAVISCSVVISFGSWCNSFGR